MNAGEQGRDVGSRGFVAYINLIGGASIGIWPPRNVRGLRRSTTTHARGADLDAVEPD